MLSGVLVMMGCMFIFFSFKIFRDTFNCAHAWVIGEIIWWIRVDNLFSKEDKTRGGVDVIWLSGVKDKSGCN